MFQSCLLLGRSGTTSAITTSLPLLSEAGGVESPSCGCYETVLTLTDCDGSRKGGVPDRPWHSSITLYLSPSRRQFLCGLSTMKGQEETTTVLPSSEHTNTGTNTQVFLTTKEIQTPSRMTTMKMHTLQESLQQAGLVGRGVASCQLYGSLQGLLLLSRQLRDQG